TTCNELSRRKGYSLVFSDFNGSPIEKAKTFLKKVAALDIKEQFWEPIHFAFEVRNKIVHAGGRIGDSKELRIRDGKIHGYSLREEDIWLEKEFAFHVVSGVRSLFEQIQRLGGFGYVDARLIDLFLTESSNRLFSDPNE